MQVVGRMMRSVRVWIFLSWLPIRIVDLDTIVYTSPEFYDSEWVRVAVQRVSRPGAIAWHAC